MDGLLWLDGRARSGAAAVRAAILGEKGQKLVHGREFRGVDHRPAFAPASDEAGLLQLGEMEGEGRARQPQPFADQAGRQPRKSRLDEQAEDGDPVLLGEGSELGDGTYLIHI